MFPLAMRLRSEGAPLGEIFSFISGLYFRGKLAYARAYANPPAKVPGVVVITAARGLMSPDRIVTMDELVELSSAPVDARESRYRLPLEEDARILCDAMGEECEAVLLGSIATPKYLEPLGSVFGERLWFPSDFVGRGDMSRGAMLLRSVREGVQLKYSPVTTLGKLATGHSISLSAIQENSGLHSKKRSIAKLPRRRRAQRQVRMPATPNSPEAVIFVGIQGSGKSTFYQKRFADTHVRINLDTLNTRVNEEQLLRDCIVKKKSFVVDNTNPLPRDRARYVAPARAAGFRVVGYFFHSSLKEAIARNRLREGKQQIPVPAIAATLRKLRRPTKMEGFDELLDVKVSPGATDDEFVVREAPLAAGSA